MGTITMDDSDGRRRTPAAVGAGMTGSGRSLRCFGSSLLLVMSLVLFGGAGAAAADKADCEYDLANVPSAPRFTDYPAAPRHPMRPAVPLLASREARLFRTVIRDAAAAGPNFAGHYTVAVWGCGASCTSAAIVDARSGQVSFPDAMNDIAANHVAGREPNGSEPTYYSLRFRPDSRLIAVLGAPAEDSAREGVAFFAWTGASLTPVRFVPRATLCPG